MPPHEPRHRRELFERLRARGRETQHEMRALISRQIDILKKNALHFPTWKAVAREIVIGHYLDEFRARPPRGLNADEMMAACILGSLKYSPCNTIVKGAEVDWYVRHKITPDLYNVRSAQLANVQLSDLKKKNKGRMGALLMRVSPQRRRRRPCPRRTGSGGPPRRCR